MNWQMLLWGLIAFLVISLPTITGLMRILSALKFLEKTKTDSYNPLNAIKPGGFAYALTFSFKITFLTAVILDYVEYVKQVYYIISLYIFFLMVDFIVQNSGKELFTLSMNIKSAFVGASLPVFTIFVLNFLIQRKFKRILPSEMENYRRGKSSPALKTFDQRG
ncbi:hypothetical protein SAMN06269117_11727 [Balnearium lithotrophicum]|uniref:Uncharacterized protein n=1 Tax=Balnearium lithotrophicum TaxID=223788 RepID=A0A521D777_9BACT|nr:hypothetical protein [Balnearium lithotrophicum]SMO66931.1 hypothetical protein SAMN06269117_11727 [Balnearium lithotrophicum]